jgi:hypothetical protein
MHTITMVFLFDSGEFFQESWELTAPTPADALLRLRRIASARLPLLASCVRIVQLKVPGKPLQRVDLRGTGGEYAHPRDALLVRNDGWALRRHLRGVSRQVYDRDRLTPAGLSAMQFYSRTLNACGCVAVRRDIGGRPITNLQPMRMSPLRAADCRPATLTRLRTLLGAEAAETFWAALP